MRRRLFAGVSAVSLLLCVGTVALWVRSYLTSESIVRFYVYPIDSATASAYHLSVNPPTFGIQQTLIATLVPGELQLNWGWTSLNDDIFRTQKPHALWIWRRRSPMAWENFPNSDHHFMGFRFTSGQDRSTSGQYVIEGGAAVAIPLWATFLTFVTFPVIFVVRRASGRTDRWGFTCHRCHYDLTGNTSGVCPECGTPVPKELAGDSPR